MVKVLKLHGFLCTSIVGHQDQDEQCGSFIYVVHGEI